MDPPSISVVPPIDFPLSAIEEMGRIGEYVTDYDAARGLMALFGISGRFGVASARDLAYLGYRLACQWLIMLTLDIQVARPAQMYCAAMFVGDGDDSDDDECEGAELCVVTSLEDQSDLVMDHCKSIVGPWLRRLGPLSVTYRHSGSSNSCAPTQAGVYSVGMAMLNAMAIAETGSVWPKSGNQLEGLAMATRVRTVIKHAMICWRPPRPQDAENLDDSQSNAMDMD